MTKMVEMAYEMKNSLEAGKVNHIGYLLNENWILKKQITKACAFKSNPHVTKVVISNLWWQLLLFPKRSIKPTQFSIRETEYCWRCEWAINDQNFEKFYFFEMFFVFHKNDVNTVQPT